MLTLELESDYPDESTAKAVMDALGPDNDGYVETELRGSTILFRIEAASAGTMRNTADDLMACLKVAEEAAGMASGNHPEDDEEE